MKPTDETAKELFRSGLNCAQSVVAAFSDELHFDREFAVTISCGFGGGMGRLQETCGALTGAFMLLGIKTCREYADNKDRKEVTYAAIRKLTEEFKAIHGTSDCRSLLNFDLKTEEGQKLIRENHLHEMVCEKCIADSIRLVKKIISE
jgi:C_GCAxxG_C_C family probable redox protein